jgi:hypothetical protein
MREAVILTDGTAAGRRLKVPTVLTNQNDSLIVNMPIGAVKKHNCAGFVRPKGGRRCHLLRNKK